MFERTKNVLRKTKEVAKAVVSLPETLEKEKDYASDLHARVEEIEDEMEGLLHSANLDDLEQRVNDLEYEIEETNGKIEDCPSFDDVERADERMDSELSDFQDRIGAIEDWFEVDLKKLVDRLVKLEERMRLQ